MHRSDSPKYQDKSPGEVREMNSNGRPQNVRRPRNYRRSAYAHSYGIQLYLKWFLQSLFAATCYKNVHNYISARSGKYLVCGTVTDLFRYRYLHSSVLYHNLQAMFEGLTLDDPKWGLKFAFLAVFWPQLGVGHLGVEWSFPHWFFLNVSLHWFSNKRQCALFLSAFTLC